MNGTVVAKYAVFGAILVAVGCFLSGLRDASYQLRVEKRAPVYARGTYPYVQSPEPNEIIGYLRAGDTPEVVGMRWESKRPQWEVRLASGERGFVFFPDVDIVDRGKR